jgi:lipopolysaccharide export system permease protein
LTAMLASGVSLYRVATPIVLVSMGISALHVVNQEFVISQPFVIEKLLRRHSEVSVAGARAESLMFIRDDKDNSLLSARSYDPVKKSMKEVFVVQRSASGKPIGHIVAETAQWDVSPIDGRECWVMRNVLEAEDGGNKNVSSHVAQVVPLKYYRTVLTPEQLDLILSKKAVDFLSSNRVHELAKASPDINKPSLYKIMHLRFTQPLMNIVMLLIGIPFLLTREPNRLVVNMFFCTAVSGFVFISTFVIFQMAGTQLNPLLAAWLPVLIFVPFALVMTDLIRT